MICSCYFIDPPPPSISVARGGKITLDFPHKRSGAPGSIAGASRCNLCDTLWIKSNIVPWLNRHFPQHIHRFITFIHCKK